MQLTATMVRALRGAPLTVLVLMMIERTPLSQGYIRRHTGYTDPVIHDALMLLADYNLVIQTGRYTWQIMNGVQQLPLFAQDRLDMPEPAEEEEPAIDRAEEQPGYIDCIAEDAAAETQDQFIEQDVQNSSKLFLANPSSSSRSLINDLDLQPLLDSRKRSSKKISAILDELTSQGIRDPAKSRLAKLKHISVEMVRYHCATAQTIGQAIYRIEHNWPVKKVPDEDSERMKYLRGEFGEFGEY